MSDPAISLHGVNKAFRRFQHPGWRSLDALGWPVSRKRYDVFSALSDIDLEIRSGERVALIGRNGAGKSTLLRLIASQMRPDSGHIAVNGKVQALMTLGTGFHPDFSGIDNIHSALAYQGITSSRIDGFVEEITDFTELNDFLHRPVKEYSAGMYARLAFAVATTIKPEILIIDEILGAGDAYFLGKSIQRMRDLTSGGTTVLFVSHDLSSVQMLCERGIWLEGGRIRQDGDLLPVSKAYLASVREDEESRVRARSMSLTRGQASALASNNMQTSLFRFVGANDQPPAKPLLLREIAYGGANGQMGRIDMAGTHSTGSHLLIDPQLMNWRNRKDRDGHQTWMFGDYGGRYRHAPFQIQWSSGMPQERWLDIALKPSLSDAVFLEEYDPKEGEYCRVHEIPPDTDGEWRNLRMALPDMSSLGKDLTSGLLADLQQLTSNDRYGSGEARITGFGFFDGNETPRHTLISGEPAFALIAFETTRSVTQPVAVVAIYRPDGTCAMQVISSMTGKVFDRLEGTGGIRVDFSPLLLGPGDYLVSVALFRELDLNSAIEPASYDLHDRCHALKILPPTGIQVEIGTVNQPATWGLLS